MIRVRDACACLMWLSIVTAAGCSQDARPPEVAPAPPASSGGEAAPQEQEEFWTPEAETTEPAASAPVALPAEDAPSPWGATRAEQCKPVPPKTISSATASAVADAVQQASSGNVDGARARLTGALSKDAGAYPAAYNLGVLADRQGQTSQAIKYYEQALAVQADYAPALRGIATIRIREGDPDAAVTRVESVARSHKTNLLLQALYAELLARAGRHQDAWAAARGALQCDERYVPALVALIHASLAQGREELADSILEQALAIDPNNAELHFIHGERLAQEPGRLKDVLEEYRKAVALRPDYAEARMALGIQLLAGGNYPDALAHFQAVVKLLPSLAQVHVNLGDAYRANQRWSEAKQAYDRALSIKSRLPEAHFGLGLTYMTALGNFPGLDELSALQKAFEEFTLYRDKASPRLPKDDRSGDYLRDLERQIKRTKRRLERERERAEREAADAAQPAATEGGAE